MAPEELTPAAAAATIADMERLHGALRARTNGLTWMVWGLAITGMFVSYDLFGVLVSTTAPEAASLMPVLWIPWVAMGMVATRELWRSAGLVMPVRPRKRDLLGALAVFFLVFNLGFWAASEMGFPLVEPGMMLLLTGVAGVFIGLLHPRGTERTLWVLVGLLLAGVTLALAVMARGDRDLAYAVFGTIGPLCVAVAYFAAGLWQASRA